MLVEVLWLLSFESRQEIESNQPIKQPNKESKTTHRQHDYNCDLLEPSCDCSLATYLGTAQSRNHRFCKLLSIHSLATHSFSVH